MAVWLTNRQGFLSLFQGFFIIASLGMSSHALSAVVDDFTSLGLEKIEGNIPAPAFSLADLQGKTVRLEDRRGKGLMLYFWASW